MFMYKSYCYSTITEVGDAVLSEFVLPDGYVVESYSVGADYITFNPGGASRVHYPPECFAVGYPSFIPGTITDLNLLLAACAAVLLVPLAFKSARMVLGGKS